LRRSTKATGWLPGRWSLSAGCRSWRRLPAKRWRRNTQHRALELRLGHRSRTGRWPLRRGSRAGRRSSGSGLRTGRTGTRDPARRVHHEHRALELRGRSALQVEPALLAGRRRVFVLSPTVRAKHAAPPPVDR
jgi:hypothetical protein